ncbi:Allantoate permease [Yamadazyma tenuis]|uniref:MFS general substrate transporter n=1 Tax=Candida tenuis (strain ATCC 10573 / BCRC 21748 / CBS 615 / JCM 9827 / NBRC 10315 / NRRL Y-1498 / VKM Y-70) TaxID=590646 RepID=G3BCJ7_CANTC|nr:MFS general substrate transporter [Yamadazyma tenuis ATCC 10573]EGV60181.1 MFS general substrate transporter [Yamadazyma tenuis ATCC 10573]WEJ94581.1 Allantoate permease [Yamadazyma tenuis]
MTELVKEKQSPPTDVQSVESLKEIQFNGKEIKLDDGDEIIKLGLAHEEVTMTRERERQLVHKIDLYMLPLMCMVYCFQFMDKLSNSFASILGLRTDLHMVGQEYSWTGSAFYLGYMVFELPASMLLHRFPVAKTVGTFIIVWGVVLALHATPNNAAGFLALRTILGALESSVTPAFTFITSQWYTIDQTFLRITIWFAFNGLGNIIGSLTAYGLAVHSDSLSLAPWKYVFIITGILTVALGVAVLAHLPDSPATAWFLTDEDKMLVVHRNRKNHQGFGNKHLKKSQVIEALTDYKTWLLFAFVLLGNVPNGGITNFGSIVLTEQLGYTVNQTLLYQTISGAVELVGCILIASLSHFYNSRLVWGIISQCIGSAGVLMLCLGSEKHMRFAGYNMNFVSPVSFVCVLSCVASNVLGTTKKYTVNVIVLIGYCVGNLSGSAVFKASETPVYGTAKKSLAVCSALQLVMLIVIWVAYYTENKIRDRKPEPEKIENIEFLDLTDGQNPFFRYSF